MPFSRNETSKLAEAITLGVSGSNLWQDADYPVVNFSSFYLFPPGKFRDYSLNYATQHNFSFIISYHPVIRLIFL
jgi:hypothetical protein